MSGFVVNRFPQIYMTKFCGHPGPRSLVDIRMQMRTNGKGPTVQWSLSLGNSGPCGYNPLQGTWKHDCADYQHIQYRELDWKMHIRVSSSPSSSVLCVICQSHKLEQIGSSWSSESESSSTSLSLSILGFLALCLPCFTFSLPCFCSGCSGTSAAVSWMLLDCDQTCFLSVVGPLGADSWWVRDCPSLWS